MKIFDWIEEILCVLCTAVMTILVFANVFSRYVLHYSLSFSEEITTYLFVLLSLMGSAIAAKRRAHLGLSILTDAVSPAVRKALYVIGFAIGMETSAMQWPEWVYGAFVPFGAFFVTVRFAQATVQEWKAPLHGASHELKEEVPGK